MKALEICLQSQSLIEKKETEFQSYLIEKQFKQTIPSKFHLYNSSQIYKKTHSALYFSSYVCVNQALRLLDKLYSLFLPLLS